MTCFETVFAWALALLAIAGILALAARMMWPAPAEPDPLAQPHGDVPHWSRDDG